MFPCGICLEGISLAEEKESRRALGLKALFAGKSGKEQEEAQDIIVRTMPLMVEQVVDIALFGEKEETRLKAAQWIIDRGMQVPKDGRDAETLSDEEIDEQLREFAMRYVGPGIGADGPARD
jgi:hypothetical protein